MLEKLDEIVKDWREERQHEACSAILLTWLEPVNKIKGLSLSLGYAKVDF